MRRLEISKKHFNCEADEGGRSNLIDEENILGACIATIDLSLRRSIQRSVILFNFNRTNKLFIS